MEYLKGYTVKPSKVTETGEVLFTDGTNEVIPNQLQCQAYGYAYNNASGTCSAYRVNTNLPRNVSNINNRINGTGNTTELGTNNVQINGINNITKGFNTNCLVNGSSNEIANGVSNATVLGNNGTALREGELVLGGGDSGTTSLFLLNTTTEDATATALLINGNSSLSIIERDKNDVYSYTVDIIGYRTGGASGSGSVSDRIFLKLEGIVLGATATETLTIIVSFGTVTGWTAASSMSGVDDMAIKVTGAASMDITWQATARFNQLKLT